MWYKNLLEYFEMFGSDCNVTNIMPSQVMFIESAKIGRKTGETSFDRHPELGGQSHVIFGLSMITLSKNDSRDDVDPVISWLDEEQYQQSELKQTTTSRVSTT